MEETVDVYRKLQQHLDTMPIGYPATKSGVEIRLLKTLFTEDEAELARSLRFSWSRNPEPLETIFERVKETGISIEDLEAKLDTMARKGAIVLMHKDDKKLYANAMFVIGIYEFQVDKMSKEFIKDFFRYMNDTFGMEVYGTKIAQFRTIPIEESITPEHKVPTYDELRKLIENIEGPIALTNCICRQGMDLLDRHCKMTDRRDVCMGFDDMGKHYIDMGWAREISKEEALNVLRQTEKEGVVLQA